MTEEERAAEYRRSLKRRAQAQLTRARALRGNASRRRQLEEDTKALLTVDEHGVRRIDIPTKRV